MGTLRPKQIFTEFQTDTFRVIDNIDPTKKLNISLSGISAETTRTLIIPDNDGILCTISTPIDKGVSFWDNTNLKLSTNSNLTWDGDNLLVDNIKLGGNTILSTNISGNLIFGTNTDSNLMVLKDTEGLHLYEDVTIADAIDGKPFVLHRKAVEGNALLKFYIDEARDAHILNTQGRLKINAGTILDMQPDANSDIEFFRLSTSGENKSVKQHGYLTAVTSAKFIQWLVDDADDYFHLARQDTNILGFKVDMPFIVPSLNVTRGIVQTNAEGLFSSSVTLPNGTLAITPLPSDNSTKVATTAYVDAAVLLEDLWDRSGTGLIPNTTGDDVGLTGTRINKGWFIDIEITNMPTVGGVSINANGALNLTSAEITQLSNIDATTISGTQWGYLGALDQSLTKASTPEFDGVISRGTIWTSHIAPEQNSWRAAAYGDGLFVAVATSGTNRIMTSTDGKNWTSRLAPGSNSWINVAYGNGLFVAVANTGTGNRVMTSFDGINWSIGVSAADNGWEKITYGNGVFVAVASSGVGNRVMTSTDGKNWISRSTPDDLDWRSVIYGNGLFVAVSSSGTGNRVVTSPDGENWTSQSTPVDNSWFDVTYGNGSFVAVANTGIGNRVMSSTDGINWSIGVSAADNSWVSIVYGEGLFVAVAFSGTGNRVMISTDGLNWETRDSAADDAWFGIAYGDGVFVAVAFFGSGGRIMTSGVPFKNIVQTNNLYQGKLEVRGDLNIWGISILSDDDITATSEGVAASILTDTTFVTTNGDSDLDNVTLADGAEGQIKRIVCIAEGNVADIWKITPANMIGGTQITFSGISEGCTLIFYSSGWVVVGNNGGTIT